jgi:hypothetical protein
MGIPGREFCERAVHALGRGKKTAKKDELDNVGRYPVGHDCHVINDLALPAGEIKEPEPKAPPIIV